MKHQYRHNLFINYYVDKNSDRQAELNLCVSKNLEAGFNTIVIICTPGDWEVFTALFPEETVVPIITHKRPTFTDFFLLVELFHTKDNINYICNTDIVIMPETLHDVPSYFNSTAKRCLALSRWDHVDGKQYPVHFNNAKSQDTWVFNGSVENIDHDYSKFNIKLGVPGCDNRIAFLLEEISGYEVLNPSISIKTIHFLSVD